jgi:phosphatidate cytidylyltransferase
MALNFKSLLTRTLTAGIFVAVLLSAIWLGYLTFNLLFFIISLWGLNEFYSISYKLGAKPYKVIGFISSAILYLGNISQFSYCGDWIISLGIVSVFLIFIFALFSKNEKPVQDVFYTISGIIYAVLPFALLNRITWMQEGINNGKFFPGCDYNSHIILGMILLIWASDTSAYLIGSLIGRTKLYERISPGKTWEGTVGGGLLTLACSYFIAGWFPEIEFKHWLVIAAIIVVFGTFGDLFESLLKRQAGIKDSGNIMPGHGGILDRFDSLIFITPFVYLYLDWVLNN